MRPRLCIDLPHKAHYIALSYCWGGPQDLTASSRTLAALQIGIDPSSFPQTLQDAICVTRRLNQRYLWVDALCILQDDSADKATEISKMPEIYQNALVTIYASKSASSKHGFLKDYASEFPRSIHISFHDGNGRRATVILRESVKLSNTRGSRDPLETRGWAMQEYHLARRVLIYGQLLWWDCLVKEWTPENCESPARSRNSPKQLGGRFEAFQRRRRQWPRKEVTPLENVVQLIAREFDDTIVRCQNEWASYVQEFTGRQLSDPRDKLPAIAGLASHLARQSKFTYLAGLWKETVKIDLIWRIAPEDRQPRPQYRAPTWSWASVDGRVWLPDLLSHFDSWKGYYWKDYIEMVDCSTQPLFEGLTYGQIKAGALEIRCHPLLVRISIGPDENVERALEREFLQDTEFWQDSIDDIENPKQIQPSSDAVVDSVSQIIGRVPYTEKFWAIPVVFYINEIRGIIVAMHSERSYRRIGSFGSGKSKFTIMKWEAWISSSPCVAVRIE